MSHFKQLKAQYEYNTKQVLYLTGMNEEEFMQFMLETAHAWLNKYFKDLVDVQAVFDHKTFQNWWKLNWCDVDDRKFLKTLYSTFDKHRFINYRIMHQYVFDNDCEEAEMLQADFRNMIEQFKPAVQA